MIKNTKKYIKNTKKHKLTKKIFSKSPKNNNNTK